MKRRKHYLQKYMVLCGCLALCSCGNKQDDPSNWVPQSNASIVGNSTTSFKDNVTEGTNALASEEIIPCAENVVQSQDGLVAKIVSEKFFVQDGQTKYISAEDLCSQLHLTEIVDEEAGIYSYTQNTCFYDKNDLLCIKVEISFCVVDNIATIRKFYFLPNGKVRITSEYHEECIRVENIIELPVEFVLNTLGYDYEWNDDQSELTVSGGYLAYGTYENQIYENISLEAIAGKIWTSDGRCVTAADLGAEYMSQFSCTPEEKPIVVEEGEIYRFNFYGSWFPEVGTVVFIADDGQLVSSYCYSNSTYLSDQLITVPAGATQMYLTFYNNQNYSVERVHNIIGNDLSQIDVQTVYLKKMEENWKGRIAESKGNYNLEKGYLTFVIDDCRADMDKIADIFEEYHMPLCVGAIYENLVNTASIGKETRLEVCRRIVENGGEILAHDAESITEEQTEDFYTMFKHFYTDKATLEDLGFEVNGIILAGGIGMVRESQETDMWARQHYLYSDLYGMEEYGEPYYHRRYWLGGALDSYHTTIKNTADECIWTVFYLHDLNEVNETTLRNVLDYVATYNESKLEVVTYKEIYDEIWMME